MYTEQLTELGLAKNEARVYESLLENGEMTVGEIATYSQVHRRNVYDTLNRLVEKGLVFEILEHKENRYQAVDPKKLKEMLNEKQRSLEKIMPGLEGLYLNVVRPEEVYIYRGIEGWKNYMRDILRLGQDVYTIGGNGSWANPKLASFFEQFRREAEAKKITFHVLYDYEVGEKKASIAEHLGKHHKFLPKKYISNAAIDIFGDHVVILKNLGLDPEADEDFSFTIMINQAVADSFRTWFQLVWDLLPE